MHLLHKLLVYIPDVISAPERYTRKDLINEIRLYADINTEDFFPMVFRYRETENAGDWSTLYPTNVLFSKDDSARFLRELTAAVEQQQKGIQSTLSHLKKMLGTDLEEIISGLEKQQSGYRSPKTCCRKTADCLYQIAALLNGTYTFHSCFYNLNDHTARLYPDVLTEIEKSPADWALVLFDYSD
ncbi:hypothetical protein [Sellimonas intestinalis]|uniref:hypothetical protein n=1 Tax=Sellimonas intestinalis TaxID=1653434 RepID=UPI003992D128